MVCMFENKGQCLRRDWIAEHLEIPSSADVTAITENERGNLPQNNFGLSNILKQTKFARMYVCM